MRDVGLSVVVFWANVDLGHCFVILGSQYRTLIDRLID